MPLTLLWQESTVFTRPATHTTVREGDPDLETLLAFGRWDRHVHVHLWLAEFADSGTSLRIRSYMGSVPCRGECGIDRRSLRAVIDRIRDETPGDPEIRLRQELRDILRPAKPQ